MKVKVKNKNNNLHKIKNKMKYQIVNKVYLVENNHKF
jgi:hypothetical protein